MPHSKGGWYGDSEGHSEAAKRAEENWVQTRWRHLKEWIGVEGDGR
jgi:hypothetical protein